MWKKLGVVLICLVGTVSVGFSIYNLKMNAASSLSWLEELKDLSGGKKADLGDYAWDVLSEVSDQYVLATSNPLDWIQMCTATTENINVEGNTIRACNFVPSGDPKYTNSPLYDRVVSFQSTFNALEQSHIEPPAFSNGNFPYAFIPRFSDFANYLGITNVLNQAVFDDGCGSWLSDHGYLYLAASKTYVVTNLAVAVELNGTTYWKNTHYPNKSSKAIEGLFFAAGRTNGTWNTLAFRPYVLLKKDDIAFALPADLTGTRTDITSIPHGIANNNDEMGTLNVRYLDAANGTVNFQAIVNEDNPSQTVNKIASKRNVIFQYQSSASSANQYISAIFYNKTNGKRYYQRLDTASSSSFIFDTNGLPIGEYEIVLVNETVTGDKRLSTSSDFSNMLELEIVEPHKLAYAKQPQSGASTGRDYEYTKNVNGGQVVGKINVNPSGVMPLTYTLDSNADNTYQNFEIDGLDANGASTSTSLNIRIKQNAPDLAGGGLKAGAYKFCVSAKDANQHPLTPGLSDQTKVCASFNVDKTDLTIAFDDPNQTNKSIPDAGVSWNETASANPFNSELKIKYTVVSGDVGLIDIDEDSGAITYKGNGAFGKVRIRATVDDEPTSGMDNYNSAYAEKEIVVYREVDGVITPHANSSDANIPTFQASDANVKTGGTIGTIKGTLGTPDTIGGSTTTYSYAIKSGGNGSFFTVNGSTGEIKTNANLAVGSYSFTITVSDKWSSKDIQVTVNVGMAPAENLQFYENSTSNTVINTKTVNFTDTNVSVFATVKGSTNTNPVTYSIKAGDPTNVIDVNPASGMVTIKGAGTVTIIAEKKGISGQADAQATLTFTVTSAAQNFIYTTDSTLSTERPKTGNNYDALTETYAPNRSFQLYTTGNPAGSTVTYQLKAGSPTDVISVDPSGLITIVNASMNHQIGKVVVQATSHDPSGNYSDKTIELPITIEKGTRIVSFSDQPIYVLNGQGSVTPNVEVDGILDTSGTAVIEIDPNEDNSIAWTNDGITIQYNWTDAQGKDVKLLVTKPADRNYKAADGVGILHILGADENVLTLSTPGKIIYGDHFTIRSTQDDSMSTNVQYTFETDNQVFISVPQVNGNKAEFDALAYSGNTEITIKVTRTADGELPLSKTVKIKVLSKPITIQIDDKTKKRLEDNPPLTFQDFTSQLVAWNGVTDYVDTSVIQLSTTAKKYSPIGSYPITANHAQKQLNDNYQNYTFIIKDGLLNIIDNGNKDFWDIDGDECPDLNIKIKDDDGNTITINGDKNEDGIPDYNIDSNGDGKPDLNIDTDNDDKPDVNLVMLKEWKPSKCVTMDDIQFSSGITAKAEINVDVDGDLIPDINIDNKGDFKAHINISKDGKEASINLADIHEWIPDHNYKQGNFAYDSIGEEVKPQLNIDTDDDGRPDVNLDLDEDGVPDLNIDTDGDLIPDINIDSSGDGKADINVDTDDDGMPDQNLMEITEWKPEQNVDQPFAYDTMKIDYKNQLEDNGIIVEKPEGTFLPDMALKVTDVTEAKKTEVSEKAADLIKENQEVKQVFDIKLLKNGVEVKPDGTLKVRIPIKEGILNAVLLRQKENGGYEKLNAKWEDGYLVYESDVLGVMAIIADRDKEIQGNYYPGGNVGGALTGDITDIMLYMSILFGSIGILLSILYQQGRKTKA